MMKKRTNQKRILAFAASAAMIVMLLIGGVVAYATPAYYVSLDVNPSLVMEVNLFQRLIGMEAMNEDAQAILAGLDWKNKDVAEVLAMAVQKIEEKGYFAEGGDILVAAAGKGEARKAELLADLKVKLEELGLEDVTIETESVGEEMVAAAKAFGLTPGKYNIIKNLLGETVNEENIEDYLALPVKDLMAIFTANKGVIGKETAESARQNSTIESLPSEAVTGQQTAEQKASEAEQKASEAIQLASEAKQDPTETLPANATLLPEAPPSEIDIEIPEVPAVTVEIPVVPAITVEIPEVPAVTVEVPDVPVETTQPTLPATSDRRP